MLGNHRVSLALALVTTVATLAVGCGSEGDNVRPDGTGGSGGTGGMGGSSSSMSSSSSGGGGAGGGAVCPTHEGPVFAVKELFFGEGNSGEWKSFGFNLDDKESTGNSTDVCKPNAGGSAQTAYPDGDQGIDNSFGKNLLPTILLLYPNWVNDVNTGIQNGNFTALVKSECMPATGDAPVLLSKLFGGTTLGGAPKFDGTDKWPVEPGLLSDPMDPLSSTILFEKSSVTGSMFDSGKGVTVVLSVPVRTADKSTSIKLTLYSAHMTMKLADDRKSATEGMIGGVLNTEEFVAEIKKVGDLLGLCGNPLFDNLVTQVRQASDIMADGTQDPEKTCDGISMGLGFEMYEAQLGDVGPANEVGSACP
ncbi:hypothetical protein KEG38_15230 [Polyangium jinanense]|uniref:hypothetical protein n=1 Tax=Polyangium jinanense TaxID=2829994 RepID=UPI0023417D8B|nr:hypothetical protein [Polyangium jinanense]MDC3955216.1 hypothetical protein [Polyangium jinanense]